MYKVYILLGIFLIIVYVYTFIKLKKRKEKTKNINTVQDFHNTYQNLNGIRKIRQEKKEQYTKYVTKYNSNEDYREKGDVLEYMYKRRNER